MFPFASLWKKTVWSGIIVTLVLLLIILWIPNNRTQQVNTANTKKLAAEYSTDEAQSVPQEYRDSLGELSSLKSGAAPSEIMPLPEKTRIERQIIRNGQMSLEVEDIRSATDTIAKIAEKFSGFVSNTSISGEEGTIRNKYQAPNQQSGFMTVKVPTQRFAEAMESIRKIAKTVLSESSTSDDVTAQVMDLDARLKNKRVEEEAYVQILKTNAQKVSDILEITKELSTVRGEIEQLETEKKYLSSQTELAEITISLTEEVKVGESDKWYPAKGVKNALNMLIENFHSFIDGFVYFVIVTIPSLLIILFGLWIVYFIGKKIVNKYTGK